MKIAVTSDGKGMEAFLDPAFGRCQYFVVFDTVTNECDSVPNPGLGMAGGAGATAAEFLKNLGVDEIITGRVGLKARPILERAGIVLSESRSGKIGDILSETGAASQNPGRPDGSDHPTPGRSPAGYCFCDSCGYRTADDAGVPCFKLKCPNCKSILERKYR
jgi:predicted Fe-Mo cluster-binding NifX family protein